MQVTLEIGYQSEGKTLTIATVDFSDPWNPGPPVTILTVTGNGGPAIQDYPVDLNVSYGGTVFGTLDTGGDPNVWVTYLGLYGPTQLQAPHWTFTIV